MPMIHNRGRQVGEKTISRKIIYPQGWDKEGLPLREGKKILNEILKQGEHKRVSDEQFKHLKANFNDEIVNIEDMKDMQSQFKEKVEEKPSQGYVSPQEVEALVQKRVDEALGKVQKGNTPDAKADANTPQTREELIARLDAMDRSELIAVIEKEGLGIEHKSFKAPGTLKAAILDAIDGKKAADEEAA